MLSIAFIEAQVFAVVLGATIINIFKVYNTVSYCIIPSTL